MDVCRRGAGKGKRRERARGGRKGPREGRRREKEGGTGGGVFHPICKFGQLRRNVPTIHAMNSVMKVLLSRLLQAIV